MKSGDHEWTPEAKAIVGIPVNTPVTRDSFLERVHPEDRGSVEASFFRPHQRTRPAKRARQEIDYGRRAKGYIFGGFCPATGEAFTHPYPGRGGVHWVDFLERVKMRIPSTTKRVYAIMENLSSHRTTGVLLFVQAYPRWEMVFQPKYAAYLNLPSPGGRSFVHLL